MFWFQPLLANRAAGIEAVRSGLSDQHTAKSILTAEFSHLSSRFNRLGMARRLKISFAFLKTSSDIMAHDDLGCKIDLPLQNCPGGAWI